MSRFGHLEFNDPPARARQRAAQADEAHCLAEAQAAFEEAEFEQALRLYARALEFNPSSAAAWLGQVRSLIELGEFDDARLWADKALEILPAEPELLAAKAVALGRAGELDGALAFSDAAVEEGRERPYVWLARGDVFLARADRQSDYCIAKALALAARDWFLHWMAARILAFYRKFALALKHAQQALALDGARGAVWLQLGLCQQGLGLRGPARQSLEQARQLMPRNEEARRALIEVANRGLWPGLLARLRHCFRS
jgi:tetratricopeptide (TPR) repeat protein